MEQVNGVQGSGSKKKFPERSRRYPADFKLQIVRKYLEEGVPAPVKEKIVDVKKSNPLFGIKRISQLLKRAFFLSASPETVRKTLHSKSLMTAPSKIFRAYNSKPALADGHFYVSPWRTLCIPGRVYR